MTSFLSSLTGLRVLLVGSLLLAAGCTTPSVTPKTAATPAAPAAEGVFDDDPRPLTANEMTVIAAGLDPAKLAAVERDLLAALQNPAATPAAVQEAAQQLGFALLAGAPESHAATLAVLAPMLADPARTDNARLALDRVPGPQVDALYVAALPAASGRTRLGLLDAIGTRAIASAVPALAGLLNDADPATAAAAARALGRIGGPAALAALAGARDPLAPVVLNARLTAAGKADAARVAGEIYRNSSAPLAQRSAALRRLIAANPADAVDEIHAALAGSEPAFHAVAIESVATLPVSGAGAQLALHLGAYASSVQIPLIAALGNRGDAGAIPGLLPALDSADAGVRLAALNALGRLPGNTDVAQRLATIATGKGDEAKAAFSSLARLNGPGVDAFIRAGAASSGEPALRAVFIQQIAARNITDAIPSLLSLSSSPVESLRLEALDALRAIAAPADQRAVIDWALAAPTKPEQTRAVRALITIILRDDAGATRADTVIAAIKAGDAPARLALLPVLSRVAGEAALAAVVQLAREPDEAVAKAATAELARWPDATVLPALVELTASTPNAGIRAAAALGSARFLSERANATTAQRSLYTRQLLALPLDAAARIPLLNVLSLCADAEALAAARLHLADPATTATAQDAIDAITSNLAGAPAFTASEAGDKTALLTDGRNYTFWAVPNAPGAWLRADLHHSRPVRKITLDHGRREWDWPDQLEVCVSDDPEKSGEPLVKVEGQHYQTVVSLPSGTRGRYVWLRQQGTRPNNAWAVAEFILE